MSLQVCPVSEKKLKQQWHKCKNLQAQIFNDWRNDQQTTASWRHFISNCIYLNVNITSDFYLLYVVLL